MEEKLCPLYAIIYPGYDRFQISAFAFAPFAGIRYLGLLAQVIDNDGGYAVGSVYSGHSVGSGVDGHADRLIHGIGILIEG